MRVRAFRSSDERLWEQLVAASPSGTFLHTRRFLAYHGERFRDVSAVVEESGNILAVLPAAVDPMDSTRVCSHPGATYGGLVHRGDLYGESMVAVFHDLREWYRASGFTTWRYKAVPSIYHRRPAEDDRYALFRIGATRYRVDLVATIDLADRGPLSRERRQGIKQGTIEGVTVQQGARFLPALWPILEVQLETRHGVRPTHRLEEICDLAERFPANVACWASLIGGEVVGGLVLFITPRVWHAQYNIAGPRAYAARSQDVLFDAVIHEARDAGARYFDFGNSNEDEGRVLNQGLHHYKVGLGAGAIVQDMYDLRLFTPKESDDGPR